MYKILVSRTIEFNAPYQYVVDSVEDWTHFSHLHRKAIAGLHLLSKSGPHAVFLYKARRLYPLPFYDHYVVFREDLPNQQGFRNVYVNAKTSATHTLDVKIIRNGDGAIVVGDHLFSLPEFWRHLPKIFMNFFLVIYQWRMDQVLDEDFEWIFERIQNEKTPGSGNCAPAVPADYNLIQSVFEKKLADSADTVFRYRIIENFDGSGRLRVPALTVEKN